MAVPSGSEAAIQQIRAVLSAAVAGAGAADGLPTKQHAHVAMPLVASEAQASMSQPSHPAQPLYACDGTECWCLLLSRSARSKASSRLCPPKVAWAACTLEETQQQSG